MINEDIPKLRRQQRSCNLLVIWLQGPCNQETHARPQFSYQLLVRQHKSTDTVSSAHDRFISEDHTLCPEAQRHRCTCRVILGRTKYLHSCSFPQTMSKKFLFSFWLENFRSSTNLILFLSTHWTLKELWEITKTIKLQIVHVEHQGSLRGSAFREGTCDMWNREAEI